MNMSTEKSSSILSPALRVTIVGGGPVGLFFALTLHNLMGKKKKNVIIEIYDQRWMSVNPGVSWKGSHEGNARRQQVVTLQSRQFSKLPQEVLDVMFQEGQYSEMWPENADSPADTGPPRNIRISEIEDRLLELANTKNIQLNPVNFDYEPKNISNQHLLVLCDGAPSRSGQLLSDKFGEPDASIYSLKDQHLEDTVLGLKVKSDLPDATSVMLTISQNRFLLNTLNGEGFLNMRLTTPEAKEVLGIVENSGELVECIQSSPCLMTNDSKDSDGKFTCSKHGSVFKPSIDVTSHLWRRIQSGLALYGVQPENLSAITSFRLSMVHRSKFTTKLLETSRSTPGTYCCLIGDAANSIHFWPGRGLNSGLASAVSLARCLSRNWIGRDLREADFMRHEALMHMLQYRQKSRAWRAMISTDDSGEVKSVQETIRNAIVNSDINIREQAEESMLKRLLISKKLLANRIESLPSEEAVREMVNKIDDETLQILVESGPWNTGIVAGEEVDVDIMFPPEKDRTPNFVSSEEDNLSEIYTFIKTPKFGLIVGEYVSFFVLAFLSVVVSIYFVSI